MTGGCNLLAVIVAARAKAAAGVDYSPRYGAVCPVCGAARIPVYATRPWQGKARTRYHRCPNTACMLNTLGESIKSLEVDTTGVEL